MSAALVRTGRRSDAGVDALQVILNLVGSQMMQIIRRYSTETAHYAVVELPDGSTVELKDRSNEMPSDEHWIALATRLWEMMQGSLEIGAEDGTVW